MMSIGSVETIEDASLNFISVTEKTTVGMVLMKITDQVEDVISSELKD